MMTGTSSKLCRCQQHLVARVYWSTPHQAYVCKRCGLVVFVLTLTDGTAWVKPTGKSS